MTRRLIFLVVALALTVFAWSRALPEAVFEDEETGKAESKHQQELPIQVYYHRSFFGEPWREDARSEVLMMRQMMTVLDVVLLLEGGMYLARRRREQ